MITETATAPEETVADQGAGSDVQVAPEGVQPPVEQPSTEVAPNKAEEAHVAASAEADIDARFDALLADAEAKGFAPISGADLSEEALAKMPASVRGALRYVAQQRAKLTGEVTEKETKLAAERAAFQAEMDKAAAEIRRQRQHLSTLANTTAIREAVAKGPPTVDPTTPEGIRAIAAYEANKGLADALAPVIQSDAQAKRDAAYDALKEAHPELKDPKVEAEFVAFLRKENEGIDPTKQAPRLRTPEAARIFTAELRAKRAAETATRARDAAAADRAPAANAINRVTTAGTGRATADIPKDVWNAGGADLVNYMRQLTPEQLRAQREELRRRAAMS